MKVNEIVEKCGIKPDTFVEVFDSKDSINKILYSEMLNDETFIDKCGEEYVAIFDGEISDTCFKIRVGILHNVK